MVGQAGSSDTTFERGRRRPTTRGRSAALAVSVTLVMLIAACGTSTPAPPAAHPLGLQARLGQGSFELTWAPTLEGLEHGYELQYGTPDIVWSTFAEPTGASVTFTAVEPGVFFSFRMRERVAPGATPRQWSPRIEALYVEPTLPVLHIDTAGSAPVLDKDNYVPSTVRLDPNGSSYAPYLGTSGIRGRGNSTWLMPKKPYRLKLDTRASLMGLSSERDWALLANALDPSQLRNYAATELSRLTELPYTPTMRHVEVVLNGRYDGVYTLTEHQELGAARVDITEMDDEDNQGVELTGGYRLEIGRRLEENAEPGFRTAGGVPVVVKDPDPMTPEQRSYIQGHVQAFETALHSPNFADPELGFRRYLDVDSFIDHFLVQELTRNSDAFVSSTFFTKERGDERFRFGPVWDFDLSIGTTRAAISDSPTGDESRLRGWVPRLFEDPTFAQQVAQRWHELRPAFAGVPGLIESKATQIAPAVGDDRLRWPATYLPQSDSAEYLANWLTARMEWMDQRYPAS